MTRVRRHACGMAAAGLLAGAAMAVPPPPPPAFIDTLAKMLVPTQTTVSFDAYAFSLADDLSVSVDGKRVAGRTEWIAVEKHRLGKVDRQVLGYVEGYDAILVFDRFDDRSDLPDAPNLVFDPRYKARAVRYGVGPDHLIHTIQIVQADGLIQSH